MGCSTGAAIALILMYIFRCVIKGIDNIGKNYHVCPQAFKEGWPEPICRAMIERDMRYYLGEWIPKYEKDDRNDEALKAKLREKDIILNSQGRWYLTGETLHKALMEI